MPKTTDFSATFLDTLTVDAQRSGRLRHHRNVHQSYQEPCQRLFNAIGEDSYVRPHRHLLDPKTECLIAVRGLMTLVMFDDEGGVTNAIRFGVQIPGNADPVSIGVEIPPDVWHTVVSNTPGSILFEVKAGPFDPAQAKEFADWAPLEGTVEAEKYLRNLKALLDERFLPLASTNCYVFVG